MRHITFILLVGLYTVSCNSDSTNDDNSSENKEGKETAPLTASISFCSSDPGDSSCKDEGSVYDFLEGAMVCVDFNRPVENNEYQLTITELDVINYSVVSTETGQLTMSEKKNFGKFRFDPLAPSPYVIAIEDMNHNLLAKDTIVFFGTGDEMEDLQ